MSQFNIFSELDQSVENNARPCLPSIDSMGSLPALLRSYGKILGWTFRFIPRKDDASSIWEQLFQRGELTGAESVEATESQTIPTLRTDSQSEPSADEQDARQSRGVPVEIRLSDGQTREAGIIEYRSSGSMWDSFEALARQAATAIADMVGEALSTRYQLWRRESELASKSALFICQPEEEDRQLAFALQEILHAGADALGCAAAQMRLLDDETSELKTRSCWGLPTERLMEPAQPLRGSAADLEAMLGRPVVMENEKAMRRWNSPEDFPAGLCVPIVTKSNVLGTVWFYSLGARRFSKRQIQTAELAASRLAAELERDALLGIYFERKSIKKELESAAAIQKNQLPISAPWFEKWDMAGKVRHNRLLGGNFYDWFTTPGGQIVCALADCQAPGLAAALTASAVKATIRTGAQRPADSNELMQQVDRTIWSCSAADQRVNLFCATLDPKTDEVRFSTSGGIKVYRATETSLEPLSQETPALGQTPETEFSSGRVELSGRDSLVVLSSGSALPAAVQQSFFKAIQNNRPHTAQRLARETFALLTRRDANLTENDFSILTIKRK